jgi:molybdopterin/thiamine biosynthesis adenylyltransferase
MENKKYYLIVDKVDNFDYFYTSNLDAVIREMYEPDLEYKSFEQIKELFHSHYMVFSSESEIIEDIN